MRLKCKYLEDSDISTVPVKSVASFFLHSYSLGGKNVEQISNYEAWSSKVWSVYFPYISPICIEIDNSNYYKSIYSGGVAFTQSNDSF